MSNIQKYKVPELVKFEQEKKLRDYTDTEFNTVALNLVLKLLNLLGVNSSKTEQHIELIQFIRDTAGHVTFSEIDKAFKMYISRELGLDVFQQLNAVVFGNVMKAYQDYKSQKLRNYRLKYIPKKTQLTDEQQKKIMDKAVLNAQLEVELTGELIGITHHIYDYLDEQGIMPTDRDYKISLFNRAKKEVLSELNERKNFAKDRVEHTRINDQINNIIKSTEVINRAKKYALIDYFSNLKNNNK